MTYALFIDDERDPSFLMRPGAPAESREFAHRVQSWIVARSYDEAIECLTSLGCPSAVSFDHDLGEKGSGYDVAKWLVNQVIDGELQLVCS